MTPQSGSAAVPQRPLRVVMAVASGIERDARVRKTALAVAAAGHEVTLIYGCPGGERPKEGSIGPVRTFGVRVPYRLRDAQVAGRRRVLQPRRPGAFADEGEMQRAQLESDLRSLRAANGSWWQRTSAAIEARRIRARVTQHEAHERAVARSAERRTKRNAAGLDSDWRTVLANVGDLDLSFVRPLWRPEPDVIHIHDIHLLEAGVLAARRLRAQDRTVHLVYDAHEYIAGMSARTPEIGAAWEEMERELIPEVDAVITVSEPIADAIQTRFTLVSRPTVTLNTPTVDEQRDCDTDVRTRCRLTQDVPLLVYSGVLSAKRGVVTAVDALVHAPEVHLAIVCVPGIHQPAAVNLYEHAESLGVADRLHLVAPVATEEIVSFLSTADVGVHPMIGGLLNHEMALPNKLFDYIFAGLPVVVSDVRLMGEFVRGRGIGATFEPGDAGDLARAVRDVLADLPALRASVRDPQLRVEYSWEAQAERIAQLYASFTPQA